MFGPLQATPAALFVALATFVLAPATLLLAPGTAAAQGSRITIGPNGKTTITQGGAWADGSSSGSSRRQVTITRRSSSGSSSSSGRKSTKKVVYKIGEKVKVDWGNEVVDAEVIGFSRTGWITVEFEQNGIVMTPTLPPDHIWRVPEKKISAADKSLRTWTSRSGKFTIKAKFVKLDEDDNLTLEKEDGKKLVVALDKLTEGDEKLARRLAGFDEG